LSATVLPPWGWNTNRSRRNIPRMQTLATAAVVVGKLDVGYNGNTLLFDHFRTC
jgi:hypothetical protein